MFRIYFLNEFLTLKAGSYRIVNLFHPILFVAEKLITQVTDYVLKFCLFLVPVFILLRVFKL